MVQTKGWTTAQVVVTTAVKVEAKFTNWIEAPVLTGTADAILGSAYAVTRTAYLRLITLLVTSVSSHS